MRLMLGDCLELMKEIPDGSVDLCLTDPPYGATDCTWDSIIPFEFMWEELHRIVKKNGAICIFGMEPFSSNLRVSNLQNFRYDWIWKKNTITNHLNAKKRPLRSIEIISVFYRKQCLYQPQLTKREKVRKSYTKKRSQSSLYKKMERESVRTIPFDMAYPTETLSFNSSRGFHPTQKPVELLEYLIKTYTLEGETVLDFTMGSGSTGVGCKNLKRNFIGIEKDKRYFEIAKQRISMTSCV